MSAHHSRSLRVTVMMAREKGVTEMTVERHLTAKEADNLDLSRSFVHSPFTTRRRRERSARYTMGTVSISYPFHVPSFMIDTVV